MMANIYTINELKEKLTPIFVKYGIIKAAVFGSYARGGASKKSDINLLLYIDEEFELENYINFKKEVKTSIKKDVDILEYRCINRLVEKDILQEAVFLYER